MSDNHKHDPSTADAWRLGGTRRSLLKAAGGGVAIAALGGSGLVAADEHEENGEYEEDENGSAGGHFIADLFDPVFGYALAAGETDDLELEHTVEVTAEEGDGAHEGFPIEAGDEVPVEFLFDPVGLYVNPGDLVHFVVVAHLHTVTAFHEKFQLESPLPTRIPADAPGFTSPPVVDDESWVYRFEHSGVYDYLCLPHLGFGMVGRVVVFDPDTDDLADEAFAALSPDGLPPNVAAVLGAPELEPSNIVEEESVAWSDLTLGGS